METPTPPRPEPPAPAKPPAAPASTGTAHVALGLFLAFTLGLLAFRGYGNWFGAKPTETASAALTDLNRAGRAELEQVPGLGPALAKQIDDHRKSKGPFKSVEELRQVKGFGQATIEKVRPFIRVEPPTSQHQEPQLPEPLVLERKPPPPAVPAPYPRSGTGSKLQPGDPPIDVNTAGIAELMRLPGVGPVMAQSIVNARTEKPFTSFDDLDRVKGIGPKTLDKLRPFVVVK